MALNKAQLIADLEAILAAGGPERTMQDVIEELADAIDAFVRTGTAGPDPVI